MLLAHSWINMFALVGILNNYYMNSTSSHLLAAFFNQFSIIFEIFRSSGFEVFHDEYLSYWLHSNQEMTVQEVDGTKVKATIIGIWWEEVWCIDLNANGFLMAKTEYGDIVDLFPDSTSVNLMDKLIIKRK